ncbi:MAG: hypothetical protein CMQ40_06150 [Gammaproteobacteria bacterium]|nr:hypothetical protein [Gammaproteobacteria bacterium]
MEKNAKKIRRVAMDLLARREHSFKELVFKLYRKFENHQVQIIEELERLSSEGLQSDSRLAEDYIYFRSKKGRGPLKIKAELLEKGICAEIIDNAFNESEIDWTQILETTIARKFNVLGSESDDQEEKLKAFNFLRQRGFEPDQIRGYIF